MSCCHFLLIIRNFYYYIHIKMIILTSKQLGKLSKEELIGELLTINTINEELANIPSRFDEFLEKMRKWNLNLKYKKLNQTSLKTKRNITYYKEIMACNGVQTTPPPPPKKKEKWPVTPLPPQTFYSPLRLETSKMWS